ncbi:MAG: hypothetical protein CVV46_15410 [Spirochaetae bacterium HGW-Spirochaetae-2]|nr:MAG: hypothetical protein CVV46_15410 [Spirochaetae bacterium HGW-Spirochaetae-2]
MIGMRKGVYAILVFVALAVLTACAEGFSAPWDHSWVGEMEIHDVDLSRYPDGVYRGDFTYNNFTYIVDTYVRAHAYEDIDVVANKDSGRARAAAAVVDRVLEEQTLLVDVVSGASHTSKALLKSIERGFEDVE